MLSSYNIKKMLPRLIVAVILANLSFEACYALINLTNIMGGAVFEIFKSISPGVVQNQGALGFTVLAALTTSIGAIAASVATGGIFAIIPALIYALFGILMAFFVIILRRMIIIILIVMAPIAAALWVLPGTEGLGKRWWKTFIQMLMVYPIIMAFIGTGVLISNIMLATGGGGFFQGISAIFALIMPFILLPAVFKLATSTIGNLTGMVNDKSKGMFDKGAGKARERAGTTKRALAKNTRKELGAKERERGAQSKIIGGTKEEQEKRLEALKTRQKRGRFDPRRMGVGSKTRGLNEADFEVMKAQQAQESVRAQSARQATYKANADAGSLAMDEAYIDDPNRMLIDDSSGKEKPIDKRQALVDIASGKKVIVRSRDGSQEDVVIRPDVEGQPQTHVARGAALKLAQQGDVEGLRTLRSEAASLQAPGSTSSQIKAGVELSEITSDAISSNVGPVLSKAPDLVKGEASAFGSSMSGGAMKTFTAGTVEAAARHSEAMATHADPDKRTDSFRRQLAASSKDLVDTKESYGDLGAGTAEQLHKELIKIETAHPGTVDHSTILKLRQKF